MAYLVNITPRAERDFASLYLEKNAEGSERGLKWYRGLKEAVLSLDEAPNRCPATPENAQLRHLLYGNKPHVYRVIYGVVTKHRRVDLLHIRHGARQTFKPTSR